MAHQKQKMLHKQHSISGCSSVWSERLIWDQEATGSNPVTRTIIYWIVAKRVRHRTLTPAFRWFESILSSQKGYWGSFYMNNIRKPDHFVSGEHILAPQISKKVNKICGCGEIGTRCRLKICWVFTLGGSSPPTRTKRPNKRVGSNPSIWWYTSAKGRLRSIRWCNGCTLV